MNDSGFDIREKVISSGVCEALIGDLSSERDLRSRAGARHLMGHPAVARLAERDELLEIAHRWLGARPIPYRATLFEKSPRQNWLAVWHQDTALPLASRIESSEWGPWSTKKGVLYAHAPTWALSRIVALRIHLNASTSENGPLRVIPGSHRGGVLSDEEVSKTARERPFVECVVGQGGVLALRPLLIHASSKASGPPPRRVLHLEYADSLTLAPGIRLVVA